MAHTAQTGQTVEPFKAHLVGVHCGFDSATRRVYYQAVCEDCDFRGFKCDTQGGAEGTAVRHNDGLECRHSYQAAKAARSVARREARS